MVLTTDFILLLGLLWILKPSKIWRAFGPARWPFGMSILFALYGMIFLFLFSWVMRENWISDASVTVKSLQAVLEIYGPFTLFLAVAIVTPFIEEVLFRGALLGALVQYIPFWLANLIQASLFMVAHEDVGQFPFYLAFGLICGFFRKRSGNLVACTALHIMNNGYAALYMTGSAIFQ